MYKCLTFNCGLSSSADEIEPLRFILIQAKQLCFTNISQLSERYEGKILETRDLRELEFETVIELRKIIWRISDPDSIRLNYNWDIWRRARNNGKYANAIY